MVTHMEENAGPTPASKLVLLTVHDICISPAADSTPPRLEVEGSLLLSFWK